MLKRETIGILHPMCTLREQTLRGPRLMCGRKALDNKGIKLEPASGLEPLTG